MSPKNNTKVLDRFGVLAKRFCRIVDSSPQLDRTEFVELIYQSLPRLIDQAIQLPDVEPSKRRRRKLPKGVSPVEWQQLFKSLRDKLGDWDLYREVFDPMRDTEAIFGSLADDIADIYRDLKKGLELKETSKRPPEEVIWEWKFSFQCHWGEHATGGLRAIYFRLQRYTL